MSQPSLVNPGPQVPVQKQRLNVYTVMLVLSFICIVTACIFLYLELQKWGSYPWWNTSDAQPPASAMIELPALPGHSVGELA